MTLLKKIVLSGFRLTEPRKKIITILSEQTRPICFEEYSRLDPSTDKSTFYRTMNAFENAHIVSGIESEEGRRYFEVSEISHPHFVCQICHSITCLSPQPIIPPPGYSIESIIMKGLCPECSDRSVAL